MFTVHTRPAAWVMALAGVLALGAVPVRAAAPYAGTWKTTIQLPGQNISLFLIQIEEKDGKPVAKVLSAADSNLKDGAVKSIKTDAKSIHFDVEAGGGDFAFAAYYPKDGAKNKNPAGSVAFANRRDIVELERTDLKELDPQKASTRSPGLADAQKAMQIKDAKEREVAVNQFLDKYPEGGISFAMRVSMLARAVQESGAEADLRGKADKLVEFAATYGPEMKLHALQIVTQIFLSSDKLSDLALAYAQQAEKALDESLTAGQQMSVLKLLAAALKKSGKTDDIKPLKSRMAKLDAVLDEEFAKKAIPFKPESAKPRVGESNRVVLVELFTGVTCPPCVAADVAFDALLQSHNPADVVMLQYHLHIPRPDPLTNEDSASRSEFYRLKGKLKGTPTVLLDGNEVEELGGGRPQAKASYDKLIQTLSGELGSKPSGQLKLSAKQAAGKINIHATVSDLKDPGEAVRLHLVLVEEVVHFAGSNGQRLHHHVVRAFPGGVKGIPLKEASASHDVTASIAGLHKSLNDYLAQNKFDEDSRPLDLKNLKVVGFIQNEKTQEVIQAAQTDLGESKSETE